MFSRLLNRMLATRPHTEFVPPGHFYSALPSLEEIKKQEDRIWGGVPRELPGIDLDIDGQLALLKEFAVYYRDIHFPAAKGNDVRYFYENPNYSYTDAIFLHCIMRKLEPKRIIEIGSGYSSCMMIDTSELFMRGGVDIEFIEPYPELLLSLLRPGDREKYRITVNNLQDVELNRFRALEKGDILFVDSTHVSKIYSDVNYILFNVLPLLNSGVHIHFHDIFYPFEYPKQWVYEGRAWNECYILRAFLQHNSVFRVVLFSSFLAQFFGDMIKGDMPLCMKNLGGSLWIKKLQER